MSSLSNFYVYYIEHPMIAFILSDVHATVMLCKSTYKITDLFHVKNNKCHDVRVWLTHASAIGGMHDALIYAK